MAPASRQPICSFGLIGAIACLAAALSSPALMGWTQAHAQPAANNSSAQINADFQAVKERAALVRLELPRLDQALETLATQLKDRADLSPAAKTAGVARVEQARAVLRSHDEALRRATAQLNTAKDPTAAGPDIDALAELLNVEGDKIASVVRDESTRGSANADRLVAAHVAYRKALAALVEAARKARETAGAARPNPPPGESRSGKGDKQ